LQNPPKELDNWIKDKLFQAVPMAIAMIDREYNVVYANAAFEKMFGNWRNQKCYSVYKDRDSLCPFCKGSKAFEDGLSQVNREVGYNPEGVLTIYVKHTIPIVDETGQIPYLIEMCTDVTETEQIRREYQLLFDQVPCSILIIDRNFRIVKANAKARQILGDLEGCHCYKGLKGLDQQCVECTASETFKDGTLHTGHHVWRARGGDTIHLHVVTVPLMLTNDSFDMVMEMAVDVTQTIKLEDGLRFAHTFLETMIATSMDGIFAVGTDGKVTIINDAAMRFFRLGSGQQLTLAELKEMLPGGLFEKVPARGGHVFLPDTTIVNKAGEETPVRIVGNELVANGKSLGMAFSVQDLSALKRLEGEKLEAERLAAVGQTVAGLAHGIKNLTTALEGGMYMMSTGMNKGNIERIQKGMDMLDRNIHRIATFVKAFLSFSKGREIRASLTDPMAIAKEVVEMYATKAAALHIQLETEQIGDVAPAALDYESMHECLTNLVGNAIDACQVSENESALCVKVRGFEDGGALVYEVVDNGCGMDYEIKKKVFTTFFTTKGLGGSGLGLLMTKKIIHEHGGRIDLESEPGKGTLFRIWLPRNRLPKIDVDTNTNP
jgi:PAS domain S-box-containing protein